MAVSSDTNQTSGVLTTKPQVFAINFQFYVSSDLVVVVTDQNTLIDTTLTISTHYTVSGGSGSTGTVTILDTSAVATGDTITIYRSIPYTQELELEEGGPLSAAALEERLDRGLIQLLQVKSQLDRCLRLGETSQQPAAGDIKDLTSKFLAFNELDQLTGYTAAQMAAALNLALAADVFASHTFADDAARAADTPDRIGQLGWQLDTLTLYHATGTNVGNWSVVQVDTASIVDLAIETAKIAALAVTTAKIAANAVTLGKLESDLQTFEVQINIGANDVNLETGNGQAYWYPNFDGIITGVRARFPEQGPTGQAASFQMNVDGNDALSTALTVDAGEDDSDDAATPAVIDTDYDDLVGGTSVVRIDVDQVGSTLSGELVCITISGVLV
jgi:hypothetical protein